jgi:hypothetical protein
VEQHKTVYITVERALLPHDSSSNLERLRRMSEEGFRFFVRNGNSVEIAIENILDAQSLGRLIYFSCRGGLKYSQATRNSDSCWVCDLFPEIYVHESFNDLYTILNPNIEIRIVPRKKKTQQ